MQYYYPLVHRYVTPRIAKVPSPIFTLLLHVSTGLLLAETELHRTAILPSDYADMPLQAPCISPQDFWELLHTATLLLRIAKSFLRIAVGFQHITTDTFQLTIL